MDHLIPRSRWAGRFGIALLLTGCLSVLVVPDRAPAQITLDGTMGRAGPLTGPNYDITANLGQLRGANLFHSFGLFNVKAGESATFSGPGSIANIISRVTGGSASSIDGILRSTIDGANLFLLNPNGILFGPNASLDVKGSFHASTADYLRFADGALFYSDPIKTSVLSVAAPAAFGFLSSNPAGISMELSEKSQIQVPGNQVLSLIGGDIELKGTGGSPVAIRGGRFNIASVGSPGEVIPNAPGEVAGLALNSFSRLGNISLSGGATLWSEGPGGGAVFIRGGQLLITSSAAPRSRVYAFASGALAEKHVGIDIKLLGDLVLSGGRISSIATASEPGGDVLVSVRNLLVNNGGLLGTETGSLATGRAGDLKVAAAGDLMVAGGNLRSDVFGAGQGGHIELEAQGLTVTENGFIGTVTNSKSSGAGGNLKTAGATALITAGGEIGSYVYGSGQGGKIAIASTNLEVSNGGQITTTTESGSEGGGGALEVKAANAQLLAGGTIVSKTKTKGAGGDVSIVAESDLIVSGSGSKIGSHTYGSGQGGKIALTSTNLEVSNGGQITTTTEFGTEGNGGAVEIKAAKAQLLAGGAVISETFNNKPGGSIGMTVKDNLTVSGGKSKIAGTTYMDGQGGDIQLTAGNLEVSNAGLINTTSFSLKPGKLNIAVEGDVKVSSAGEISTYAFGSGQGGDTQLTARNLEVSDGGFVNTQGTSPNPSGKLKITVEGDVKVSSAGEISSFAFGRGQGGDIELSAKNLEVSNTGMIRTVSDQEKLSNGGSLTVHADQIVLKGTDSSQGLDTGFGSLNYGSGKGGDIHVFADSLIMANRSRIFAQTGYAVFDAATFTFPEDKWTNNEGRGGNIDINAKTLKMSNGPNMFVETLGKGDSGDLKISAGELRIEDYSSILSQSGHFVEDEVTKRSATLPSEGKGGNIEVTANTMVMNNHANIGGLAFGYGDGGNIKVTAGDLTMTNAASMAGQSQLGQGKANAGNLEITAGNIFLSGSLTSDNPYWGKDTTGFLTVGKDGRSGNIRLTADSLQMTDNSGIATNSVGEGRSGDIVLEVGDLQVRDGSLVSASTAGKGDAGNINITTNSMLLSGVCSQPYLNPLSNVTSLQWSGIGAESGLRGVGNSGNVRITADRLQLLDGARITTQTYGSGRGGDMDIAARQLFVSGVNERFQTFLLGQGYESREAMRSAASAIRTDTNEVGSGTTGRAGNITLRANDLTLTDRGLVTARSASAGDGGSIVAEAIRIAILNGGEISTSSTQGGRAGEVTLSASESLTITGAGYGNQSGIYSNATGSGDAGRLTITTPRLTLADGATISTAAAQGQAGSITITAQALGLSGGAVISSESFGPGDAGNIAIGVSDTFLSRASKVKTSATEADGGNILLFADYMARFIDSEMSASVGGGPQTVGGNITIDPEYVILQNSRIIANAYEGKGGNIRIVAGTFLADPTSLVDASSALGINGTVDIRALVQSISSIVQPLPRDFISAGQLLRNPCEARLKGSKSGSLIVTGRRGLPPEPGWLLPGPL